MRNMYLIKKEAEERRTKRIFRLMFGMIGSGGAGMMSVGFGLLVFLSRKGILSKEEALPLVLMGIAGGIMILIGCVLADMRD